MENAKYLLTELTKEYPPKKNCNHAILCIDNKLRIQLSLIDGTFLPLILEDDDLKKPIDELLNDIIIILGGMDS